MTLESGYETPLTTLCACGHPMEEHDPIAARYCRATTSGGLQRGCICVVTSEPPPR